jgi:phosphomannomutase
MTLIKSISGIRGTIGGIPGDGLSPLDVVKFTAAFARFLQQTRNKEKITLVVGRDGRISGDMVNRLVCGTLMGMGADVIDAGLSTTPTVEMAVPFKEADGGIILTASHNPIQWNALKLLNHKGEFINAEEGEQVLSIAERDAYSFAEVTKLGSYTEDNSLIDYHIEKILALPLVDTEAIQSRNFTIAVDAVNSTGGIALPKLLDALGVSRTEKLFCEPTGRFPHNPEPLPEHLTDLSKRVVSTGADAGFVVDPDVDRLAIVCENGSMFGEEYTLVAVADYILSQTPGNTVSNLSSSRALRDIAEKHGGSYAASAVGEVHVVQKMKETDAVIGGEGNGGIIYPALHYGRDALVGIALFLSHLAHSGKTCSELRASYPSYFISKNKVNVSSDVDPDEVLKQLTEDYKNEEITTIDGLKIDFQGGWVHLRKSNTEPIIRVYAEAGTQKEADAMAEEILTKINQRSNH